MVSLTQKVLHIELLRFLFLNFKKGDKFMDIKENSFFYSMVVLHTHLIIFLMSALIKTFTLFLLAGSSDQVQALDLGILAIQKGLKTENRMKQNFGPSSNNPCCRYIGF